MALKTITSGDFKKSRAFADILMSFKRNPFTDDASIVRNDNAIKQAIKNLILTTPGEKPFQPTLDPFTADAVKDEIINTVNQYEPRVELTKVDVTAIPEGNKLNITLEYRIVGLPIVETIEFVLQRPE